MDQKASITDSGNSNVIVYIDTTAIAYALISCLAMTQNVKDEDVEKALEHFHRLWANDKTRNQFVRALDQPEYDDAEPRASENESNHTTLPIKVLNRPTYRR